MDERQNTLESLRELREILHAQLLDAEPSNVGRISSEYSKTLLEIDRLEREGNQGGKLTELLGSLQSKPTSVRKGGTRR